MWVSEVFESIQGEGRYTGVLSGFIRTSGCNLRCNFCDTPYTSWKPEGVEQSLEQLLLQINAMTCQHVVLTGGEPLLIPDLVPFSRELKDQGFTVTVETAGTVARPEVAADLMSISPKLRNSVPLGTNWEARHEQRRHRPDVIRHLTTDYDYQLKFVVDTPRDLQEIENYLLEFPHIDPAKVYLMPMGTDWPTLSRKIEWMTAEAQRRGWQVTPRLHIKLYGNRRGT